MQIHRLLTKPHSESLLQGSFRFGRLRYYQMLEIVFEDDSIGDAHEGSISSVVNTKLTPKNINDPVRVNLKKMGFIDMDESSSVEISNYTFRNEVDCFVCCWSTSEAPTLSGTGSAYDTRVTAAGGKTLAHYLSKFAVERESGRKLNDLFFPIASGRVHYCDLVHDMASGPLPSGDPFRKRNHYQHQLEYRLVLIPRSTISADFVHIECPQASELLASMPINRVQVVAPIPASTGPGREHFQQLLETILAAWQQVQDALARKEDHAFKISRLAGQSDSNLADWRADWEASLARRTAALAEFDRVHLKNLRRCLFELRSRPLNDALDRALARGASSDRLISLYQRRKWGGLA